MRRRIARWSVVALAALATSACGAPADVTAPPDEPPFVTGTIVSAGASPPVTTDCVSADALDPDAPVTSDDPPMCDPTPSRAGSIHVRGERDQTEIVVSVDHAVPLVRRAAGGNTEAITFAELTAGAAVSLWITGPVMESHPLQGSASYVLLEEEPVAP